MLGVCSLPVLSLLLIGGRLLSEVAGASTSSTTLSCNPLYAQCGGMEFTGPSCCASGSSCQYLNVYYSQCLPPTTSGGTPTSTASTSSTKASVSTTSASLKCGVLYSQCGGSGFTGPSCCTTGICTFVNAYYSQCLLPSTSTKTPTSTPTAVPTSTKPSTNCQTPAFTYSQCGGTSYTGPTCCVSGTTCTFTAGGASDYRQCFPITTTASPTTTTTRSTLFSPTPPPQSTTTLNSVSPKTTTTITVYEGNSTITVPGPTITKTLEVVTYSKTVTVIESTCPNVATATVCS